jgi:3-oxoacyl-[acyl-carrier-protein] synthase-3
VRIVGLGSYLPKNIVSNKDLELKVNTSDEWVRSKLGIKSRRICDKEQKTSDIAFQACKSALKDSGKDINDIDAIIVATSTPDRKSPSTACIVQEKFDCKNIPAFDINAVCSGFIYGLNISDALLKSGAYKSILLVGAEKYSSITDWNNRNCVFFGDGAGAVILENSENGFFHSSIKADGKGKDGFTVPPETGYFEMKGKEVFKQATKVLPKSILDLLSAAGVDIEDISICIPHQPSIRILESTAEQIGLPFEKVARTMHKYANTAGASIPVTLDDAYRSGKIKNNDLILFTAVGSGWTWGSAIMRWNR